MPRINTIKGTDHHDRMKGTAAADNIYAYTGDDILKGRAGDDSLIASDGNDILVGGGGHDRLIADYDYNFWRPIGNDWLSGGAGNDLLDSGGGNDKLRGGPGEDTLQSGDGVDLVKGGSGNDTLYLDWDDVSFEPGLIYGPGPDVASLPENIEFVALRDARISGNSGTDRLIVDFYRLELDLTAVANDKIRGIEIIDFTQYGVKSLTLNKADILDISSSTDTLTILGHKGDKVNIVGAFKDLGVSDGFHHYKVGAGTLLVDTDITNVS